MRLRTTYPIQTSTPTPTEVDKALEGSIKKWKGVVKGTVKENGTENCPLCQMFFNVNCDGCPVSEHTGKTNCNDTPYEDWVANGFNSKNYRSIKAIKIALEEVEFLKNLRQV